MGECGLREVPAARTPFSNQAAATGWAWTASGAPLFPGYLSPSEGVTFESLGRVGYAAWDAVPESGKFQIVQPVFSHGLAKPPRFALAADKAGVHKIRPSQQDTT